MPPGTHPVTRACGGGVLLGGKLLPPIALEIEPKRGRKRQDECDGREGGREEGREKKTYRQRSR